MDKFWELSEELPNKDNKEVINEFLLSLKLANRSKGTINEYRSFLKKFFGKQENIFSSLSSDEILAWFQANERSVKETTLRLRMSIISSFFKFCVEEEYIAKSPLKSRWFPRLPKPVPRYLEKGEIAKARQSSETESLRNRLLFEFMLSSGCRVGEVVALNIEDIDLENRSAQVTGKGRKLREVHFSDKCGILLERYLNQKQSGPLFLSTRGGRLGIRMIQKIMNRIGENMSKESSLYPHRLRHTFATELATKGVDLSFISAELGHQDITTTQIYARIPNKELVALYRKFMG